MITRTLLLFLLVSSSMAAAPARADVIADRPIYREAFAYAARPEDQGGLGLPRAKARVFAQDVARHGDGRVALSRYINLFSQFDLSIPALFETARLLSDHVCTLPEEPYRKFADAFQFAFAPEHLSLEVTAAVDFGRRASELTQERFEAYRAAFNLAQGAPYFMSRPYALLFANSAANRPAADTLERYRFAFSNIPENSAEGFQASLSLAEELSELAVNDYRIFALVFRSSLEQRHTGFAQAREAARAQLPAATPASSAPSALRPLLAQAPTPDPLLRPLVEYHPESATSPALSYGSGTVPARVREDAAGLTQPGN